MPGHNIGIIGAGPVGSLIAAHLARNNENIYLVDIKEELISAIDQQGISVTGTDDNFQARVKGTDTSVTGLARFDIDLYFIAVKFNFLNSVLDDIKKFLKHGQKILLIQNGIDNEDRAAEKFSPDDVLRFVINYAGMIIKPGTVKMSFFHPPNYIGALSPENEPLAREIANFISEAGLETAFTPEIKKYEWRKTILNAALMPVCATTDLTMKEAMEFEETRFLTEQILLECIQVAKKLGYEYEDDFVEKGLAYLTGAGHHKPSMSLDLEAGNPVEYVYQPIIDYGKEIGSPTPYLEALTRVVRTLESQKRKSKS